MGPTFGMQQFKRIAYVARDPRAALVAPRTGAGVNHVGKAPPAGKNPKNKKKKNAKNHAPPADDPNQWILGWEDLMGAGDADHNDMVFRIERLTGGTAHLSPPRIVDLVRQMADLHDQGRDLILVSSGAIAVGRQRLDFPQLPKDIPAKQMLAAIGQPRLMALYEQLFGLYGLMVAQVMLTRTDLSLRTSYLNSRNTLEALIARRVIPIVNENDTVATEEIRVGDNDNLSAMVVTLIEADLLVLLTDQSGLFTADPRQDPGAQLIDEVTAPDIPQEVWQAAGGAKNGLGTGGMVTKLQAADLARRPAGRAAPASGRGRR